MDTLFRRVWRWHFWAGLMACPVLLVVALTGALYTFREEIEDWQQADARFVEPVGDRKPLSEQIATVKAAHPDWTPKRVTLSADPRKNTIVQVERPGAEKGSLPAVFVNPYSAAVVRSLIVVLAGEWLYGRLRRCMPIPSSIETPVDIPVLSVPQKVSK